jgi:peptidyl-prolyl cis-trans isomerase C
MTSPPRSARLGLLLRTVHKLALIATLAVLSLSPSVQAQEADPVVARVNGIEIRESDLAIVEEEIGANLPQMPPEARREYLITFFTDTLLVAQAAEQKGVGDTAEFKRRLAFARNRLLSELLLQQQAKSALTEENMRKVYQEAVAQMGAEQEVRARHILFRVEDEKDETASKDAESKVKAVIARLKKGEDFAKLAAELTEDPSGKDNGGDLGYFSRDQMVPEFAEIAFKLDVGAISEPVKTQFGWHVLKVEDKRTKPVPEFEKVRDQIERFVIRRAQSEFVAKLRADAKIERVQPAAPPAGAADAPKKP